MLQREFTGEKHIIGLNSILISVQEYFGDYWIELNINLKKYILN